MAAAGVAADARTRLGVAPAHKSRGDGAAAPGLRWREGVCACVVAGPGPGSKPEQEQGQGRGATGRDGTGRGGRLPACPPAEAGRGGGEGFGMAASAKSFLADAGYGEQELDANSALMELDKGEAGRARGCRRPGERGWGCR